MLIRSSNCYALLTLIERVKARNCVYGMQHIARYWKNYKKADTKNI